MRCSILVFIALVRPFVAYGAEQPLTLDAAVDLALARAPQIAAGQAATESANSLAVSAGRLPDPQAIVGIDNLPVTGADSFSTTRDFMTMRRAGLMQTFTPAAQRRSERAVAAADIALADSQLQATRYEVARATAGAWVRYAATSESLERLRALETDLETGARAVTAALKSGRTKVSEAFAADASVTQIKSRILQLQGELRRDESELARWIGSESLAPPGAIPPMDELAAEAEELRASVHKHVSLRPFDAQVEVAEAKLELARAARRPAWSTEISYAKRGPDYSDMASLQFTVDLPIFARNRQSPVIDSRGAEVRRAQAEREAELLMHQAEFEQMLVSWETTGEQLRFIDAERLPLARERTRAAVAAYRGSQGDIGAAIDSFEDEAELLMERASLQAERGMAWSYLRYLDLAAQR